MRANIDIFLFIDIHRLFMHLTYIEIKVHKENMNRFMYLLLQISKVLLSQSFKIYNIDDISFEKGYLINLKSVLSH